MPVDAVAPVAPRIGHKHEHDTYYYLIARHLFSLYADCQCAVVLGSALALIRAFRVATCVHQTQTVTRHALFLFFLNASKRPSHRLPPEKILQISHTMRLIIVRPPASATRVIHRSAYAQAHGTPYYNANRESSKGGGCGKLAAPLPKLRDVECREPVGQYHALHMQHRQWDTVPWFGNCGRQCRRRTVPVIPASVEMRPLHTS